MFSDTRTSRTLLDRMITACDNESTCMLLKQLADTGRLEAVNLWLAGPGRGRRRGGPAADWSRR